MTQGLNCWNDPAALDKSRPPGTRVGPYNHPTVKPDLRRNLTSTLVSEGYLTKRHGATKTIKGRLIIGQWNASEMTVKTK